MRYRDQPGEVPHNAEEHAVCETVLDRHLYPSMEAAWPVCYQVAGTGKVKETLAHLFRCPDLQKRASDYQRETIAEAEGKLRVACHRRKACDPADRHISVHGRGDIHIVLQAAGCVPLSAGGDGRGP